MKKLHSDVERHDETGRAREKVYSVLHTVCNTLYILRFWSEEEGVEPIVLFSS